MLWGVRCYWSVVDLMDRNVVKGFLSEGIIWSSVGEGERGGIAMGKLRKVLLRFFCRIDSIVISIAEFEWNEPLGIYCH